MGVWVENMDAYGWLVLEAERYQPCFPLTANLWAGCPCMMRQILLQKMGELG